MVGSAWETANSPETDVLATCLQSIWELRFRRVPTTDKNGSLCQNCLGLCWTSAFFLGAWNLSTCQQRAPVWPAANKNLGAESHEFPQVAAFHMCLSSLLGKLSESCVSPLTRDSWQLELWVLILMTWCEWTWWAESVEYIKALVRRRRSGASGACPLGEVTRQWHLRHRLGAKYRLLHFAPPIVMKGRVNLGFGGGTVHTWGPCRDTYARWHRRLWIGPWGGKAFAARKQMLLGPQDSAGPRDYRICSGHRDVTCFWRAPVKVLERNLQLFSH